MKFRIAQLTDSHIALDHPQRIAALENCIRCINAEDPQPDAVIHTGDITHNGLAEEYAAAKRLLDQLKAPYFVLAGNKDKRPALLQAFADNRYLPRDSKWIQYSIEHYPVRLLVIDTVHDDSNKGQVCLQRLANIEQMLKQEPEKPVAVFMHHPPFEATGVPDPYQYEDWADAGKLHQLLSSYDTVSGVYCGHVHRNIDSMIAHKHASAITCLAGDLRKGDVSDEERALPVYRILTLA